MAQLAEFATNHPILVAGLFAAIIALIVYELRLKSQEVAQVSALDAVRLINKGAVVIDVRSPEAFAGGHVVNARNTPLDTLDPAAPPLSKQKDKLLLTVCDTGASSGKAAQALRRSGFDKTFSVKGGLNAWRTQNLPLVK
jgi:rhodanese-related sulfurtransferase